MICHKCGANNHVGERFCNSCGAPLDGAGQRQAQAAAKSGGPGAEPAYMRQPESPSQEREREREPEQAPPATRRQFYKQLAPKLDRLLLTVGAVFCYVNVLLAVVSLNGGGSLAWLDLVFFLVLPLGLQYSPRKWVALVLLLFVFTSLGLHYFYEAQINNWPALIGAVLLFKGSSDLEEDWRQYREKGSFEASI